MPIEITPDEKRMAVWNAFLRTYTTVISALECEMREEPGLALIWYNVLNHLNNDPQGGLRLQDLAGAIALSQSGLTRLVDRMSKAGLVERAPCPHDRRGAYAVITPKGKTVLEQAAPAHRRSIVEHFMQHLSDEDVQALYKAFSKIIDAEIR